MPHTERPLQGGPWKGSSHRLRYSFLLVRSLCPELQWNGPLVILLHPPFLASWQRWKSQPGLHQSHLDHHGAGRRKPVDCGSRGRETLPRLRGTRAEAMVPLGQRQVCSTSFCNNASCRRRVSLLLERSHLGPRLSSTITPDRVAVLSSRRYMRAQA